MRRVLTLAALCALLSTHGRRDDDLVIATFETAVPLTAAASSQNASLALLQ